MKIRKGEMTMPRGDSESFTIELEDELTELPIALVPGDTVRFTVKKTHRDILSVIQKVVTYFPDGVAEVEILPEDTHYLDFGDYEYDIELTDRYGEVTTIIVSKFTLGKEITHG